VGVAKNLSSKSIEINKTRDSENIEKWFKNVLVAVFGGFGRQSKRGKK